MILVSGREPLALPSHAKVPNRNAVVKSPCPSGSTDNLIADGVPPSEHEAPVSRLREELLPRRPDEWLVLERECWDQLRLRALDPIRETAQRILVEIHLAEGNRACAVKRYQEYRRLLLQEWEVEPSRLLTRLVQDAISA